MPTHMAVHVCFVCVSMCPETISTTLAFEDPEPAGGGSHRPAHVQPGLTPEDKEEVEERREKGRDGG